MSLVTCARVGDALTKWLDTAAQQKKDALCAALGCGGGGGMTDEEIAAVFMNCDGVAHIPGAAIPTCDEMQAAIDDAIENIFNGGNPGQVWTKRADGTQGWADPTQELTTADSTSISLTGEGTTANPLSADVIVNPDADNLIEQTATGLKVSPELPAGGTEDQVLTTDAAGEAVWADPAVQPVNTVNTADSASVAITGDGTAANPLSADVRLATGGVNRITAEATGLRVTAELPPYTAADNGKKLVIVAGEPEWQEDEPCLVQTRAGTGTLAEDDTGKLVLGTGGTITAPASLPIGFRVDIVGEATVAVTGGTLRSVDGNAKVAANGGATLIKTSATEFWLAGALES